MVLVAAPMASISLEASAIRAGVHVLEGALDDVSSEVVVLVLAIILPSRVVMVHTTSRVGVVVVTTTIIPSLLSATFPSSHKVSNS